MAWCASRSWSKGSPWVVSRAAYTPPEMRVLLLFAVLLATSAATCAPYQRVGIESAPEGAEVYLDGTLMGTTPLELRIPTGREHSVFLKKEGYRSRLLVLNSHERSDGIDFLTPADLSVRMVPETGPQDRDLEIEVEPAPGR